MSTALDYSAAKLQSATIKAAGHVGVIRYVGTPGRTKNITKAEFQELTRNGVSVALVYENKAGDANGGFSAGVTAARAARADADSIGWPRERPIYFAIDSDQVTDLDFDECDGYLNGASSVMGNGIERSGAYGEFDVIERFVGTRVRYGWQTVAWSKGKRSKKSSLFQRLGQIYVGGIKCDVNDILASDWGQHNIQQGNDDMQLTDNVKLWDGRTVTVENCLAGVLGHAEYIEGQNKQLAASVSGLAAALEAATKDPGISLDAVKQIVNEAVAQHIQITGEVHIGPAK